jgi:hypothetical protein
MDELPEGGGIGSPGSLVRYTACSCLKYLKFQVHHILNCILTFRACVQHPTFDRVADIQVMMATF